VINSNHQIEGRVTNTAGGRCNHKICTSSEGGKGEITVLATIIQDNQANLHVVTS
jgi:hypothetical protein